VGGPIISDAQFYEVFLQRVKFSLPDDSNSEVDHELHKKVRYSSASPGPTIAIVRALPLVKLLASPMIWGVGISQESS